MVGDSNTAVGAIGKCIFDIRCPQTGIKWRISTLRRFTLFNLDVLFLTNLIQTLVPLSTPEKLSKVMETKSASTAKDISGEIAISLKGHDESLATLDEPSDARMSLAQHEVK